MDNNAMAVQNALQAGGIQLALPQRLEPITKTERQVQSVQYDPEKLQALIKALQSKRVEPSKMDVLAKALAQAPETRSYTGGFGEEIVNPWTSAISALARGFGSAYSNYADAKREAENAAREDAIKAAQLEAEASKQAITDTRIDDQMKLNDPNAKLIQAAQEKQQAMSQLDMLEKQLEDIGTRYDNDYENIDDMEKRLTKADAQRVDALWGFGVTAKERKARNELNAWTGNIKNILVNANRQAGSGNMSDADAERYEQGIAQAKTLPQKREILRSFKARMLAGTGTPASTTNKTLTMDDIWKQLGE